jgi:ABC-2 type transport system ATP-binding protein
MSTADPVIAVTGLSRSFGGRTAVRDVSMQLSPGEVVGLVGANGGGKTTTLRMIAGLLRPTGGSGMVLGADVGLPRKASRHRIGYMTQSLALYPELTVAENLRFRARALCGGNRAAQAAVVEDYGLTPVLSARVAELSGGWTRRVQFAATVIHRPALLLLDEPTAGLDAKTRHDMWGWISGLAAGGSTILVSTHDLHEAERCPLIIHFRDGQAEGPFPPETLIRRSGTNTLEAAIIAEASQ